jgi:F0F1-type ATP synthase membrane subunit a
VGVSSPLSYALWGFGNMVAGALLLHFFWPVGDAPWLGWCMVGMGALLLSIQLSIHFGKVRAGKH